MPRDGAGLYTLPAAYLVNSGDTVLPAQHNPPFEDVAAALTGSLPVNGVKAMTGALTLSGDPASALHAATKQYVDNFVIGLNFKQAVKAASTANLTLSAPQTIDGVSVIAGDRVLAKNQSAPAQNGVYVVAAGAWARSSDMDVWSETVNANVWSEQGTVNADTGWVLIGNSGGTLGSTAINVVQFGGTGAFAPYSATMAALAAIGGVASVADWRAGTLSRVLTTDAVLGGAAYVTLTDAATIAVDLATGTNFQVTLGGNRTLGNPTNPTVGKGGRIKVIQDATGTWTLAYGSNWLWEADPTLSTAIGAADYIIYEVESATRILCAFQRNPT
jgi:hypothetical protein